MESRTVLLASAAAIVMLAAGCSGGPSGGSSGAAPRLKLEKTSIVVDAFPAIDSAGLYIAQMNGLFAQQGLHVTIVRTTTPPPTTQDLIKGQVAGKYDITAGDYVSYIVNQLGAGAPKADLRIVAEASFLQPNVLALLVRGGSSISTIGQLKNKNVSVNAPNDIGTVLVDSLLVEHGLTTRAVRYSNVPFPNVGPALQDNTVSASFAPEPFVSLFEANADTQELADLDQGSTANFPIQGYAVTAAWAKKYPNTLRAFTTALSQGQEIADTDRAAVESAIEKYLGVKKQFAAFISLPSFPLGVDAVRLQRVVGAMVRFNLLPQSDKSFQVSSMISS